MDENVNESKEFILNDMQQYLESITISEDDPGIILTWCWAGIGEFCTLANAQTGLPQPRVNIRNIGNLTPQSFCEDLVAHLLVAAGNRYRQLHRNADILFAPNDIDQYTRLICKLSSFSFDPFVQSVLNLTDNPIRLSWTSLLSDKMVLTSAQHFNYRSIRPKFPF